MVDVLVELARKFYPVLSDARGDGDPLGQDHNESAIGLVATGSWFVCESYICGGDVNKP